MTTTEATTEATTETPAPTEAPSPRRDWHEAFEREEIRELLAPNDLRSAFGVLVNWALVAAAMALVAFWPNPLTVIASLFVIGGRQLGCAILMHDASHRSLFSSRRVNDVVGQWLGGYPVWSDLESYRPYHLQHHAKNWTEADPDLALAKPFPITPASFARKTWRDLSGQTGLKFLKVRLAAFRREMGEGTRFERLGRLGRSRVLRGVLATNLVLFGATLLAGAPALYLLWVVAWMTTYTWIVRVRSITEHSMAPDPTDPLRNTRTTLARWWERILLAPLRVNYHLEHHLLMTMPFHALPRFHQKLRERGLLEGALVAPSYGAVLRQAITPTGTSGRAPGLDAPAAFFP